MHKLMVFTVRHDLSEDRIRLIAASEDGSHRCAYWLTRRLTGNILRNSQSWLTQQYAADVNVPQHAQGDLYDMYHDQAKDSFEQQQAMRKSKPVEDTEHADLLLQIDIQKVDQEHLKLIFFSGEEAEAFSIMTVTYFHQLLHILQVKSDELDWQLAPVATATASSYALQ